MLLVRRDRRLVWIVDVPMCALATPVAYIAITSVDPLLIAFAVFVVAVAIGTVRRVKRMDAAVLVHAPLRRPRRFVAGRSAVGHRAQVG